MKLQLKHKLVVGTSIGIVCLVLLVASRYSTQKSPTIAMPIPQVEVVTVEQKDIPILYITSRKPRNSFRG